MIIFIIMLILCWERGWTALANNQRKVDRRKVKEMVEDWEGRKLPRNISFKALIGMVADEARLTLREEGDTEKEEQTQ